MNKTLLMCAAMLVAAGAAKADFDGWLADQQASASVFDIWSPGGYAWSASHQPEYARDHILLANGDRQRILDQQAQMGVEMLSIPIDPHMLGYAFYTGYLNNHVTFTVTPSRVASDTSLIMMGIVYTGNIEPNPILHYGLNSEPGIVAQEANLGESIVVDDPNADVGETQFRVYTWDFSPGASETFSITFAFPHNVAISHVIVSQVPEPAAGVLLVGAVAAGAVWFARRRRNRV